MNCPYCGASNPEFEHRCLRCGRRLIGALPMPRRGSAVPNPARESSLAPPLPNREAGAPRAAHQQSLFRVIPFETIAPPKKTPSTPGRRRQARRDIDPNQTDLGFSLERPLSAPAGLEAKPSVQCQAAVAGLGPRVEAATLDIVFVATAFGAFLAMIRVMSGVVPLGRVAGLVYSAAFALLFVWYKLLACLLAAESPGAHAAGLRLLRFDGRPANRRQRILRVASGCLSVLPLGIGLLWAVVDEEHLTFHDHITETFTTLAKPER